MSIRSAVSAISLACLASLAPIAAVWAEAPGAQRVEVPIKFVPQPNGARRFAVPIKVGATFIDAGLDTGSDGLRILPGTLRPGDAQTTQERDTITYGAGAKLDGVVAIGMLDIGGLKGTTRIDLIDQVGCMAGKPNCAAARVALADYGIMGNGIAGGGFKAILGVGPRAVRIDNPFRSLGVTRYIVDMPRHAGETGRIILNPSKADLAGFIQIPAYRRDPRQTQIPEGAVAGCLARISGAKVCGALIFDTGAPGMRVTSPDALGEVWPQGTKASLVLDDGEGHVLASHDLTIGARSDAAHLVFQQRDNLPKTVIRAGIAPYFAYSVLYDLDRGGLAVRPR